MTIDNLIKSERWLHGPEFLWKPEQEWISRQEDLDQDIPEDDVEVKEVKINSIRAEEGTDIIDKLLNHYSSWFRLKKAVAWILKLKMYLIFKARQRKGDTSNIGTPTTRLRVADLQNAESVIVQHIQKAAFPEEMKRLSSASQAKDDNASADDRNYYVKKSSPIAKLDPFVENGIIKVGGAFEAVHIIAGNQTSYNSSKEYHNNRYDLA